MGRGMIAGAMPSSSSSTRSFCPGVGYQVNGLEGQLGPLRGIPLPASGRWYGPSVAMGPVALGRRGDLATDTSRLFLPPDRLESRPMSAVPAKPGRSLLSGALGSIVFAVAVGVLAYVVVRAYTLSFTHDEGFTYREGVRPGFEAFFRFEFKDANNHFLNSLLAMVCERVFGSSAFALRLPNVLAVVPYLCFGWLAVRELVRDPVLRLAGFLALALNPFVLDFFSLCRGYGLALGLMMPSVYCMVRGLKLGGRTTLVAWGGFAAAVGVLANLSVLNWLLAYWGALVLLTRTPAARLIGTREGFEGSKTWLCIGVAQYGMLMHVLLVPILWLKLTNTFYYGGVDNIWTDTVVSVVRVSLYEAPYAVLAVQHLIAVAFVVALASAGREVFRRFRKREEVEQARSVTVLMTALGTVMVSIEAQHRLLGNPYLIERTAQFLIPLVVLSSVAGLDFVGRVGRWVGISFASLVLLHAGFTLNLERTLSWDYDADTSAIARALGEELETWPTGSDPARIMAPWLYEPSLNFYRVTMPIDDLAQVTRQWKPEMGTPDFVLYAPAEPPGFEVEMLGSFLGGELVLARTVRAR